VSIAKAGITTTLNTRTTVLAAANPAFGRYDVRRSPAENINLPAALLSRFDILWLMLDRPSMEQDLSLAQHVLTVHREGAPPPPAGAAPLPPAMLRAYIAAAKQHEPYVPDNLTDYVAAVYAEMRAEEAASDVPHTYTTARTLLSILRLSQALARLRFADSVEQVGGPCRGVQLWGGCWGGDGKAGGRRAHRLFGDVFSPCSLPPCPGLPSHRCHPCPLPRPPALPACPCRATWTSRCAC
jgi:hypothetical protein